MYLFQYVNSEINISLEFVYQLVLILLMKMLKKRGTERKETSICWEEKKISVYIKRLVDRIS